jgi:hypothetical protein
MIDAPQPSEADVSSRAEGTFEVKVTPLAADDGGDGTSLGRMALDKQFQGDFAGTGKGEMLTGGTSVRNSAGYVAMERVTGAPHGRRGSFLLQHTGTMARGAPGLRVTVVPDSGTSERTGLSGALSITVTGGKHYYTLDYSLNP